MVVTGSVTAEILMVWFFSVVNVSFTREAVITGILWLVMNWVLDLVVLVRLLGMTPSDYARIGLGYLVIPVMVISAMIIADRALASEKNRS